jgi:hypothetical protein
MWFSPILADVLANAEQTAWTVDLLRMDTTSTLWKKQLPSLAVTVALMTEVTGVALEFWPRGRNSLWLTIGPMSTLISLLVVAVIRVGMWKMISKPQDISIAIILSFIVLLVLVIFWIFPWNREVLSDALTSCLVC